VGFGWSTYSPFFSLRSFALTNRPNISPDSRLKPTSAHPSPPNIGISQARFRREKKQHTNNKPFFLSFLFLVDGQGLGFPFESLIGRLAGIPSNFAAHRPLVFFCLIIYLFPSLSVSLPLSITNLAD